MEYTNQPTPAPESKDYGLGAVTWISGIFFGILAPLIIWIIKKDDSSFMDKTGKNVLNFHISYWIWYIAGFVLVGISIATKLGFLIAIAGIALLVIGVMMFVCSIIGAIKSGGGDSDWNPPLTLRLLK